MKIIEPPISTQDNAEAGENRQGSIPFFPSENLRHTQVDDKSGEDPNDVRGVVAEGVSSTLGSASTATPPPEKLTERIRKSTARGIMHDIQTLLNNSGVQTKQEAYGETSTEMPRHAMSISWSEISGWSITEYNMGGNTVRNIDEEEGDYLNDETAKVLLYARKLAEKLFNESRSK